MLVVVDTNVLLVSISDRSRYYWLYDLIGFPSIPVLKLDELRALLEKDYFI